MLSATLLTVWPVDTTLASSAGFNFTRQSSDHHPSYGGTLLWGTTNPPTILNPILTHTSVSSALVSLIFDSLVRMDSKGHIVPGLAEQWDISPDGLVYTFYLRKDVVFHDGHDFSAEDVKYTYEAIGDVRNKSHWRSNTEMIRSWKIINPHTIEAVLDKPSVTFLYKFLRPIAPRHLLEGKDLHSLAFNYHPIGTGPFKFKSWDRQTDRIELEANTKYFEGRPYLDRIVVKTYPDIASLWSALMRREIDLLKYIRKEDYYVLKADPAFKAYKIPWDSYYALAYNLRDPLLSDLNIRKAIAHSINIEELIRVASGEGVVSVGPFHPQSLGFNSAVKPLGFNPSMAMDLLRNAGWKDLNADGILEKNGKPLALRILVNSTKSNEKTMAMLIRQQLSQVGIKVEIKLFNGINELDGDPFAQFKVHAWLRLFDGSGSGLQSYEPLMSWYSSSSLFGRYGGYKNRRLDDLFDTVGSMVDIDARKNILHDIHGMIYADQPACFLFYPVSYHALASDFENADDYFTGYMPTYSMKEWYRHNKGGERDGDH